MNNEQLLDDIREWFNDMLRNELVMLYFDNINLLESNKLDDGNRYKVELSMNDEERVKMILELNLNDSDELNSGSYELIHKGKKVMSVPDITKVTDDFKDYVKNYIRSRELYEVVNSLRKYLNSWFVRNLKKSRDIYGNEVLDFDGTKDWYKVKYYLNSSFTNAIIVDFNVIEDGEILVNKIYYKESENIVIEKTNLQDFESDLEEYLESKDFDESILLKLHQGIVLSFKIKGVDLKINEHKVLNKDIIEDKTRYKLAYYTEGEREVSIMVDLVLNDSKTIIDVNFELLIKEESVLSSKDIEEFADKTKNYLLENVTNSDDYYNNLSYNMKSAIIDIHKDLKGYNPDGDVYFNEEKSNKEDLKLFYDVNVKGSKLGLKCELIVIVDKKTLEVEGLEGYLVNDEGLYKKVDNFQNIWIEANKELDAELLLNDDEISELRIEKLEEWLNKNSHIMGHVIEWDDIVILENNPKKAIYDVIFNKDYNIDLQVTITVKYLSSKVDVYDDNVDVVIENNNGIFKESVNFESMFGIIKDLKDYDDRVLDDFKNKVNSHEDALDNISFNYIDGNGEDSLSNYNKNKLKFVMNIDESEQGLKVLYSQGVRLSKHDDRVLLEEEEYILTDDTLSFKEDVTLNNMWDKVYQKEPSLKKIDSSLENNRLNVVSEYFKELLGDEIPLFSDVYDFNGGLDEDSYQIDFSEGTFKDNLNLSVVADVEFKKDSSEIKSFTNIIVHNGGDEGFEEVEVSKAELPKLLKDNLNKKEDFIDSDDKIERYEKAITKWHSNLPGFISGNVAKYTEYNDDVRELTFNIDVNNSKKGISIITTATLDETGKFKKIELYLLSEDGTLDSTVHKDKCWLVIRKVDPSVDGDASKTKINKKEYEVVLKENNSKQSVERLKRMHQGYILTKGNVSSKAINHEAYGKVLEVKSGNLDYLISYGIVVDLNDNRVIYDFRKEEDLEKALAKELKLKQYQGEDSKNYNYIFNVYLRCRDLRRNNQEYLVELANKLYNK